MDEVWGGGADETPTRTDTDATPISARAAASALVIPESAENARAKTAAAAPNLEFERLERILGGHLTAIRAENERRFQLCVGGACVITVCLLLYIDRLQLQLRHQR